MSVLLSDLPVHPEQVLPLSGGAAGHALRPGHRHVVSGLHPGGDAHRRASVQRLQRGEPSILTLHLTVQKKS